MIDLGGATAPNRDGILLDGGKTLYVMQNRLNQIAVIKLDRTHSTGEVVNIITDADFDVPTTIAEFGDDLYAVNARFGTPPTPDTEYDVVRVSKHQSGAGFGINAWRFLQKPGFAVVEAAVLCESSVAAGIFCHRMAQKPGFLACFPRCEESLRIHSCFDQSATRSTAPRAQQIREPPTD